MATTSQVPPSLTSANEHDLFSCLNDSLASLKFDKDPDTTRPSMSSSLFCLEGGPEGRFEGGLGDGTSTSMIIMPSKTLSFAANQLTKKETQSKCGDSIVLERPGPYDIVCGRNSASYNSAGNRRFRITIDMNLQRYMDAPTREDKTKIVQYIANMLQEEIGCRFLKKLGKHQYAELNSKQIREKVGHSLRDLVQQQKKKMNNVTVRATWPTSELPTTNVARRISVV